MSVFARQRRHGYDNTSTFSMKTAELGLWQYLEVFFENSRANKTIPIICMVLQMQNGLTIGTIKKTEDFSLSLNLFE